MTKVDQSAFKTQDDVITLSPRFSLWRDQYQWFLYDFRTGRYNDKHKLKKLPNPTYHPKLSQLVDYMVQLKAREAETLEDIAKTVGVLNAEILTVLSGYVEPLGITPSDAAEKRKKAAKTDPE